MSLALVQIKNLLDSYEERHKKEVEKEQSQKLADEARARAKRESDEKERMFQRMQQELATQAAS